MSTSLQVDPPSGRDERVNMYGISVTSMDPISALIEGAIPEHVVSFEGTSQYTQGGISTCGLAALNAVRIVLGCEQRGINGVELLRKIASKEMISEVVEICAAWSSQLHLEVDDISALPLFDNTLSLFSSEYNQAEAVNFTALLRCLEKASKATQTSSSPHRSSAVVITRPPEILAVFNIPIHNLEQFSVFVVFDSHPRPMKHTRGASFILFSTVEATSRYISSLLQVDKSLFSGLGSMQWQAQLLGHYSGHVYVARNNHNFHADPIRAIYDANMAILEVKSRLTEAEEKLRSLTIENTSLQERLSLTEIQARWAQSPRDKHISHSYKPPHNHSPPPVAGPSTHRRREANHRESSQTAERTRSQSRAEQERIDATLAARVRREEEKKLASLALAQHTQEELDNENDELLSQMHQLQKTAQILFECTICFEKYPEDFVARVDDCKHELCRGCMRDFVISKLEEHRYPMLCPLCHLDKNLQDPGVITEALVEQMGLTDAQQSTWIELELSQFSIVLDCPKCERSTFVDRTDLTDMKLIQCPLPDCNHVWCKSCQRQVEVGTRHSCDGTLELDDLIKQRGWRKCPGCQTPAAKESGCNHMTCPARGCNTHFCYVCGESIVQSVRARDIQPALRLHYRRCHLFEDVPDRNAI